MEKTSVFDKVVEIVKNNMSETVTNSTTGELEITPKTIEKEHQLKNHLGLDSLDVVNTVIELEQYYEVSMDDDELPQDATIGDLVKYVTETISKQV